MDSAARRELLARRKAKRAERDRAADVARVVAEIRAFYYDGQRRFLTSKAKRRATRKSRRAGITVGGVREFFARALESKDWRGVYVASTRPEAEYRAWETDTKSGFLDVLRQIGTRLEGAGVERYDIAGIVVEVRQQELALDLSNGSRISLFGADSLRAVNKKRGGAPDVIWVDEAQDFRFLTEFYKGTVVAAMTDFDGEVWFTGTPGLDLAGMFYEVTRHDGQALAGWELHELSVTGNPMFGRVVWDDGRWFVVDNIDVQHGPYPDEVAAELAAKAIRWERTALKTLRENGWDEDDPDFIREWLGRWVKIDARFVYAVHKVADHVLTYAPHRVVEQGVPYGDWPDILAAMRDLPGYDVDTRHQTSREYFLSLGADLGKFAWALLAWSLKDPVLYEVASWRRYQSDRDKTEGLDYDEMEACLIAVRETIVVGVCIADAGGGGKQAVTGWGKRWNARYATPMQEMAKYPGYKPIAIKQINTDIRHGHFRFRDGSPLLEEAKAHRWLATRSATGALVEDPATPNHACDAGLIYAASGAYHHRFREPVAEVKPGSVEFTRRDEAELERYAIDAHNEADY